MAAKADREVLTVAGQEISISNPNKVLFPQAGYTKLDLVRYYLAVADGALRGAGGRPNVLVRYPNGIDGEFFYQKRAPQSRPAWIEVVSLQLSVRTHARKRWCRAMLRRSRGWRTSPVSSCTRIPFARTISIIPTNCASISIRCRASSWPQVREVAACRAKQRWTTSASSAGRRRRGRAACTSTCASSGGGRSPKCGVRRWRSRARSSGARPTLATSKWWKEERHGVFLDYNQNAKDRTIAERLLGAAEARRAGVGAADMGRDRRLRAGRFHAGDDAGALREVGDRHAAIDRHPCSLEALLELSARQEKEGLGDAPWPPQYRKQAGEAAARAAVARGGRPKHPLIEIGRARSEERRRARGAGALAGAASRSGRASGTR